MTKLRRIDVVFPSYINSSIGPTGTLRRLLKNKKYIYKRGYDINIYSRDFLYNKSIEAPVDFKYGLNKRSSILDRIKKSKWLSILFLIRNEKKSNKLVDKYLSLKTDADIVVFHDELSCYRYLRKRKETDAKVVLFHHSNGKRGDMLLQSFPEITNSCYMKRRLKKVLLVDKAVDRNVFISYDGSLNFRKENPTINNEGIVVIHNGIDDIKQLDRLTYRNYKYNLCCTGTICRRKGQYIIIEALNRMNVVDRKNIHIDIIGNGSDWDILKASVVEYNLENNVTFWGMIENSEIHSIISKCNIYILMSNNEGLPISILEAMRAGLGIISTNVSGIPEEVDERNGILIEPSVEQLTDVFNHIDEYDWVEFGKKSRERFENEFSFHQMLKSYCDMMDTL